MSTTDCASRHRFIAGGACRECGALYDRERHEWRKLEVTASDEGARRNERLVESEKSPAAIESIPMRLHCPECHALHVDEGEWATRVHHTHSCQNCGLTWRPAIVPTVGVRFLPGIREPLREVE